MEHYMQAMKDKAGLMMSAMSGQVATNLNNLFHRTDSPFTVKITSCLLLAKFRMAQLETYDGLMDSIDYLKSFMTLMHFQGIPYEIMC